TARILAKLGAYPGLTGLTAYVVCDAPRVPGLGATFKQHKLTVIYTKEKETADACIERLVNELARRGRNIYVATSDLVEQHVAFGQGALRISARELLIDIDQNRKAIDTSVSGSPPVKRNPLDGVLSLDVKSKLERLRRGLKD